MLNAIAIATDSFYGGKPSWRRLISRIAKREISLECAPVCKFGKHSRSKSPLKVATLPIPSPFVSGNIFSVQKVAPLPEKKSERISRRNNSGHVSQLEKMAVKSAGIQFAKLKNFYS